jgi:hypothetical protein
MSAQTLTHNGAIYGLQAEAVSDLLARGVIVPDGQGQACFELGSEHLIEEVEPFATVLERLTGDEARGEGPDAGQRLLAALRSGHRDGQGGR